MILWTIQPLEIWNMIQQTGLYRCDPAKSTMLDLECIDKYDWLVDQMKRRIGSPPEGVYYPVWAWYMQNGKHKKPDLRSERWGYSPGNEDYACIEFDIPDDQVLLSDFDEWSVILLNGLLSDTKEEDDRLNQFFDTLPPDEQKVFKEKNWERAFYTVPFENHWTRRGDCVQATFWELRKEYIQSVRFFRTGHKKEKLMPRVFFAGSIPGDRPDEVLYHRMLEHIRHYADVLTERIGKIDLPEYKTDRAMFDQDTFWLRNADMLIAECTFPSLGIGYELARAETLDKPCHIFYNSSKTQLSPTLSGNQYFILHPYEKEEDINAILDGILKQ